MSPRRGFLLGSHLESLKIFKTVEHVIDHPIFKFATVSDTPFSLSELSAALGYREQDVRGLMTDLTRKMNMLVVPVHREGELVFGATFAGEQPDDTPSSRALLHTAVHIAYDCIAAMPQRINLTQHEADYLYEVARGNSYKTADALLGLAERTVRAAVASAKRKLNARTRSELLAKTVTHFG